MGDYEPYDNRQVEKPTNNWHTFTHLLKSCIGTGVLAMPMAFAHTGYVFGLIASILIGIWAVYCLHVLIRNMYALCKRERVPYIGYSDSMKLSFEQGPPKLRCLSPIAVPFVDGFLCLYHFGICCVYVVFIAQSTKQLMDENVIKWNVRVHMLLLIIPLLLIFSIRSLWLLAPFSFVANCLLLVGFIIILYFIGKDIPSLSTRDTFIDIKKFPTFFGTILFAMEAVGVILAIEENMETPRDFVKPCGILNWGFGIVVGLYATIGFFGYWKYGSSAMGSVTLNIPQNDLLSEITKGIFAVTVYISYALQGYVTAYLLWHKYLKKHVKRESCYIFYELLIRYTIVLLSVGCALAIPNLSLFLSLVGSFCLTILGLIFPIMMEICVQYVDGYGKGRYKLIINIFLLILGVLGWCMGTYLSIVDCIHEWS